MLYIRSHIGYTFGHLSQKLLSVPAVNNFESMHIANPGANIHTNTHAVHTICQYKLGDKLLFKKKLTQTCSFFNKY